MTTKKSRSSTTTIQTTSSVTYSTSTSKVHRPEIDNGLERNNSSTSIKEGNATTVNDTSESIDLTKDRLSSSKYFDNQRSTTPYHRSTKTSKHSVPVDVIGPTNSSSGECYGIIVWI